MFSGLTTQELINMVEKSSLDNKRYAAGYVQAYIDLVKEGVLDVKQAAEKLNLTEEAIKNLVK